jgi:hypothetical protein
MKTNSSLQTTGGCCNSTCQERDDIHDKHHLRTAGPVMDDVRNRWARLLAASGPERAAQPLRICELCVDTLDVTGAGIAMVTAAGHRGVVCATNEVSAKIEDLQLTLGEGPCIDAAESGSPVLLSNLGQSADVAVERWPTFMESAADAGVEAVFAFPLRVGAISVGVIDLYRDRPGRLTSADLAVTLIAADAAALALLYLDVEGGEAFMDDHDSRAAYQLQVHQATGMVMAQTSVTIDQAFLMLRARAFAEDRTLADLARDVVARRVRFSMEDE